MADDKEKATGVDPERLEVSIGGDGASSLDAVKGEKGSVKTTTDSGQGLEFDQDGGVERTGLDKETSTEEGEEGDKEKTEDKPEDTAEGEPNDNTDLGDWDAEDEEVGKKFDERYFTEKDGSSELNMEAFSAEVAANAAKEGGTPVLNEATYGWLKDRMGVSKDYADSIIRGQIALREQNETAFYAAVGGKEVYASKLEWAKGVYTPAQKDRFNAAILAGGEQAQEALELLNTRWEKAGNKLPGNKRDGEQGEDKKPVHKGLPQRRPASPAKSTSSAENPGGSGGAKPFANAEEHRKAMRDAERSGDKGQIALVRKRLAASTFWK